MTYENDIQSPEHEKMHEAIGINARPIIGWAGVLAALVVVSLLLMGWLLRAFSGDRSSENEAEQPARNPTLASTLPPLDPAQSKQLDQLLQRQQAWLSEFARSEQRPKYARIPLESAVKMLADNNLQYTAPQTDTSAEENNTSASSEN